MKTDEGRYSVCDENRRAPNNLTAMSMGATQHFGVDGEADRFDNLQEALEFAKTIWEHQEKRHVIVVRDNQDGGKTVWTGEADRH